MSYESGLKTATELALDKSKTKLIRPELETQALKDEDVTSFNRPKTSCKHCYGRGIDGWNNITGDPILCDCVTKNAGIGTTEEDRLTWFEFRSIMETKLKRDSEHLRPKSLRREMSKIKKRLRKSRKRHAKNTTQVTEAISST